MLTWILYSPLYNLEFDMKTLNYSEVLSISAGTHSTVTPESTQPFFDQRTNEILREIISRVINRAVDRVIDYYLPIKA